MYLSLGVLLATFGVGQMVEAAAGRNVAYFFRGYQHERSAAPEENMEIIPVEEIDMTGPGSAPLSDALESRIARYLLSDRCPIGRDEAIQERCEFLLNVQRMPSGKTRNERLSPRTRNAIQQVGEGVQIYRSIGDTYRKQVRDTASVIRVQKQRGGLRGRPRSLSDVKDLKTEVERARATRRSERESSVPLPLVEDLNEADQGY
ncbi:MAG: hypothetical protein AAB853_00765 [Patescibacteria group bacterium]